VQVGGEGERRYSTMFGKKVFQVETKGERPQRSGGAKGRSGTQGLKKGERS